MRSSQRAAQPGDAKANETFGQATATTSYQNPRWFQFSVGVRF